MTKAAVLANFAAPAATVTGADVGKLLERLLYLASTGTTTTMYFIDGRVSRAETFTR